MKIGSMLFANRKKFFTTPQKSHINLRSTSCNFISLVKFAIQLTYACLNLKKLVILVETYF